MPVLFVWAEQPLMAVTLEQLQEAVRQAQLVEVLGTAHFAHLDAPERFNEELDRFIDGLGDASRQRGKRTCLPTQGRLRCSQRYGFGTPSLNQSGGSVADDA